MHKKYILKKKGGGEKKKTHHKNKHFRLGPVRR
uniref:Uncharacterized protein n=1 Tax=Anguilla anguilla TaxID=7936 RepID=A0A0E9R3M5_ANGAN